MKRKAFTLTELLVVVVIIGVLSAVVLPKFTKVLGSLKTSEAEEMMTAVRNEQEARCTLSKNYQGDLRKLGSYRAGKNFSYANNSEGVGIVATAKSNKYSLEIPSYADGRVCCRDIEAGACGNLNKSYPLCSDLINNTSDYVAGNTDCEVPGVGENPEVEPGVIPERTACETPWTDEEKADCRCDSHETTEKACPAGYKGNQTRTESCDGSTGTFKYGEWDTGACEKEEESSVEMTTCGMWVSPTSDLFGDDVCTRRGLVLPDSKLNIQIPVTVSDADFVARCCKKGTTADCAAEGSNYYWDGQRCVPRFTIIAAKGYMDSSKLPQDKLPIDDNVTFFPDINVYAGFQERMVGCQRTLTPIGDPIAQCSEEFERDLQLLGSMPNKYCESCDEANGTCGAFACYRDADLVQAQQDNLKNNRASGGMIDFSTGSGNYSSHVSSTDVPFGTKMIGMEQNQDVGLCQDINGATSVASLLLGKDNAVNCGGHCSQTIPVSVSQSCPSGTRMQMSQLIAISNVYEGTIGSSGVEDEKPYWDGVKNNMNWNVLANILQADDKTGSDLANWVQQNADMKTSDAAKLLGEYQSNGGSFSEGFLSENYDNPVVQEYMFQSMQQILKDQYNDPGPDKISFANFSQIMGINASDGYTYDEWFLTNRLFAGNDVALEFSSFGGTANGSFDSWSNRYDKWSKGESGWLDSDTVHKDDPPEPPTSLNVTVNVCVEKYLIEVPIYKCSRGYAYERVNNPAPTNY